MELIDEDRPAAIVHEVSHIAPGSLYKLQKHVPSVLGNNLETFFALFLNESAPFVKELALVGEKQLPESDCGLYSYVFEPFVSGEIESELVDVLEVGALFLFQHGHLAFDSVDGVYTEVSAEVLEFRVLIFAHTLGLHDERDVESQRVHRIYVDSTIELHDTFALDI